jgi:hypothetical protein
MTKKSGRSAKSRRPAASQASGDGGRTRRPRKRPPRGAAIAAAPVTAAELRALRRELERRFNEAGATTAGKRRSAARRTRGPLRWNPQPEDVQKSVARLVLTLMEFLRKLMERQAIRRMDQKTLTRRQADAVGNALMTLEQTIRDIGRRFGLEPEDLNLDLGPVGKLM